ILPGSVVFGLGLYVNGAQRYDVMDDKIRIVGALGEREVPFHKINGFDDAIPASLGARLQSFLTGAHLSSGINIDARGSFAFGKPYLWVTDREPFLRAAREALADQHRPAT